MKNFNCDEIIDKYIKYAEEEGASKINGDYKLGNQMSKKLERLFDRFRDNKEDAECIIEGILNSDCRRARILIAVDALRIGILEEKAVSELKKNIKRGDVFSIGAEIALENWRRQGGGSAV